MKNLSEADVCLGIQIQWNWKSWILTINQHVYIDKVLKDFSMNNSRAVHTSIDSYKYIKLTLKGEAMADQLKYQKVIKSLMYIITATHSDLIFAVDKFSQFCHLLSAQNWAELQ